MVCCGVNETTHQTHNNNKKGLEDRTRIELAGAFSWSWRSSARALLHTLNTHSRGELLLTGQLRVCGPAFTDVMHTVSRSVKQYVSVLSESLVVRSSSPLSPINWSAPSTWPLRATLSVSDYFVLLINKPLTRVATYHLFYLPPYLRRLWLCAQSVFSRVHPSSHLCLLLAASVVCCCLLFFASQFVTTTT